MRSFAYVVGLAMTLAAGSANAAVVYDTLTGQTAAASNLLTTAGAYHEPLGADFNVAYNSTINSVSVGLIDKTCATSNGFCTDTGSVIVYLVQGNGASTSLPKSSGLALTNPMYVGTILDSALAGGAAGPLNLITLTTNISLAPGTWWLELVSGNDPNNFHKSINSVASTAKWGEIASTATGTVGLPTGWLTSGSNTTMNGIIGGVSNNSNAANPSPNDMLLMARVDATPTPEPATISVIGAALIGLGVSRRRRGAKASTPNT